MSGSPESVLAEPQRILICGVNWVGDVVMSLPALEAYRSQHPGVHLSVLTKPSVRGIWEAHDGPDELILLGEGFSGVRAAAATLRTKSFHKAYIFPNSFRSALIPFMAGIPERIGVSNSLRWWMLTQGIPLSEAARRGHQSKEYYDILGIPKPETLQRPRLAASPGGRAEYAELFASDEPFVALIPGAARGPSKQWPAEHFITLGRRLAAEKGLRSIVLGAAGEAPLCQEVADALGEPAVSLAGKTSFAGWMACLEQGRLVVCNDSGGMHLAAALGVPVLAVFGLTDPLKTGPLGGRTRVVQGDAQGTRTIPRDSAVARNLLASISPERVYAAAQELLAETAG